MAEVPERSGREALALVRIFSVLRFVRLAVTDWVAKFAVICASPCKAYMTALPAPAPMVVPLNVAEPVAGTEAAGERLPNAKVPAGPARPVISLAPQMP